MFLSNRESVEFHHSLFLAARWPGSQYFKSRQSNRQQQHAAGDSDVGSRRVVAKNGWLTLSKKKNEDDDNSDSDSDSEEEKDGHQLELGDPIMSNVRLFKLHGSLSQTDRLGEGCAVAIACLLFCCLYLCVWFLGDFAAQLFELLFC